jgi:hypothetical protein
VDFLPGVLRPEEPDEQDRLDQGEQRDAEGPNPEIDRI